ncbi:MAG: hypothetical protein LUC93_11455 [Planctomycetaceae bacterium]|nr:hypothetical protein [Planctomycetaceae bacterium]
MSNDNTPPKRPEVQPAREPEVVPPRRDEFASELDGMTVVDPEIVAEQIEAGYDIQSDAAVMPMSSDEASSVDGQAEGM